MPIRKTLLTQRKVLAQPKLKYRKEKKTNNSNLITLKRKIPNQIPATYTAPRPRLNPTHLSLVPPEQANTEVA